MIPDSHFILLVVAKFTAYRLQCLPALSQLTGERLVVTREQFARLGIVVHYLKELSRNPEKYKYRNKNGKLNRVIIRIFLIGEG